MFAGIYYGGMYGGSTTSILLNTPGESASVITAIEGNKMAKLGRGAAALATAAIGSFVAGTIATVLLTLFAPIIARFGVQLTPADFVALIVVAFITVGALLGARRVARLASLGLGLFIGLIGTEGLRAGSGTPGAYSRCPTGSASCWSPSDSSRSARRSTSPHACATAQCDHPGERGWRSWMKRKDLAAVMAAVAARHSDRIPDRDDTRGRGRRRDLPVVRG